MRAHVLRVMLYEDAASGTRQGGDLVLAPAELPGAAPRRRALAAAGEAQRRIGAPNDRCAPGTAGPHVIMSAAVGPAPGRLAGELAGSR